MTAVSRVVWSGLFTMMSTTVVVCGAGGKRTASMTWTTPLSARMSATVTVALLIITEPPMMETVTFAPLRVVISWPSESDVLRASPPTTWYVRMALSNSASARTASIVPAGRAAKAASVGAKTVNGPWALKSSARPAATTAASSVVWSGLFTMMSTTVFVAGVGGRRTALMTCTTPLLAVRSATVTNASLIITAPPPIIT